MGFTISRTVNLQLDNIISWIFSNVSGVATSSNMFIVTRVSVITTKVSNPHFHHWNWWCHRLYQAYNWFEWSFFPRWAYEIYFSPIFVKIFQDVCSHWISKLNVTACAKFDIDQLPDGCWRKQWCYSNWTAGNSKSHSFINLSSHISTQSYFFEENAWMSYDIC